MKRRAIFHTAVMVVGMALGRQCVLADGPSSAGLAGSPLRMGFGGRGIGLGNAASAILAGDVAAYYNPALTPFQTVPVVAATYGALSLDRRLNFFSYTQHLKPVAGVAFSVINAGVGNIDGRDRDGQRTEIYSTSENTFMLSFGLQPDPKVAIGVTAKILYYSLYQSVKSTTAGIDIGALYRISDEITVAGVVQDIGSKYKWDTNSLYGKLGNTTTDQFPLRKRLGIAFIPRDWGMMVSAEYELMGSESFVRAGFEYSVIEGFAVRGGIDQVSPGGTVASKPSVGFEAFRNIGSWTPVIQYTYVIEPYSPSGIHLISLSLRFL